MPGIQSISGEQVKENLYLSEPWLIAGTEYNPTCVDWLHLPWYQHWPL
jgi:hypothetical protein